jgi:hypothetical protein
MPPIAVKGAPVGVRGVRSDDVKPSGGRRIGLTRRREKPTRQQAAGGRLANPRPFGNHGSWMNLQF